MNLAPHDDDTLSQAAPPMPAVAPAARNARRLMPKRFDLPSTRVQSDGKGSPGICRGKARLNRTMRRCGRLGDESKTFTHA